MLTIINRPISLNMCLINWELMVERHGVLLARQTRKILLKYTGNINIIYDNFLSFS